MSGRGRGPAPVGRRIVFQGLGGLGVAAALAGCAGGDDEDTDGGSGGGSGVESGTVLASASEVPVGGGLVLPDQKVVITQPTRGDFKAFTAVCTHQNCIVAEVTETIDCTCHGSKFDLATGEPLEGPAPSALAAVEITVEKGQVVAV